MKQKLLALMKKLLLLFLAIHVSIICAADGSITIDGITYGYINKNWDHPRDYAYVKNCSSSVTGNVTIRSSISYNDKIYNVTSIDHNAFENCSSMTSINIPDGVTSISYSAFEGCSGLTSINIPNSVTSIGSSAFEGCSGLTSINIPDGVTSIRDGTFHDCTNLQTVNISNNSKLESIDGFYGCSSLTSINIPDGVTSIGDWAFDSCTNLQTVSISNSSKLTGIGSSAFEGCSGLTSINIPDGVTRIERCAFEGCSGLTSINIPDGVTSIGDNAFSGCTKLQTVSISNNSKLTDIEDYAFNGCSCLTSINIPDGVTSIGDKAFSGCTKLQTVSISNNSKLTDIGYGAFRGCSSLTSINIPDGVTSIGGGAFQNCTNLQTVSISNNSKLGTFGGGIVGFLDGAFEGCKSLTSINIPDGVTIIRENTFNYCTKLQTVSISNNSKLTDIGNRAFYGCSCLESFLIPAKVETVGTGVFYGCSNISKLRFYCKNVGNWFSSSKNKVEEILIGNSVETIGSAFESFSSLTNLQFEDGSSLKEIKRYAFHDCDALKEVDLPEALETLGNYAFYSCGKLETIKLPKTLKAIHDNAFIDCPALKDVYAYMPKPFGIDASVFSSTTYKNAVLHVNGVAEKYRKRFAWSKFFHIINIGEIPGEGDGGIDSDNSNNSGNSGGSLYTTQNYYYDLTAQGNGEIVVDEYITQMDLGMGASWTQYFEGLTVRDEQKVIEIPHFPGTGVPFKFIPDNGYYVKQVLFTPENNGTPQDVTNDLIYDPGKFGYTYQAVDQDSYPKLVAIFEKGTPVPSDAVTLTAKNYSRVYGESNPAFEFTVSNGTVTSGTPTISCSATTTSPVGTYPITITKGSVTNTSVTCVNGTLTITKAPLTIKAGNYTKVEGEENPVFTLAYEGFKNNETSAVLTKQPTVSCSATKDSPAGSYPVTVSGAEAQNYEISYVAGTLTITENSGGDNPELKDGDVFTATNAEGAELTFQVISAADKTCQVVRKGKDSYTIVTTPVPESITIPGEVKGFKVISIGYQAFYGARGIKSVVIPEGVTSIDTHAFRECYNLASFTFPKSLKECGLDSFEDCAFGAAVHISDLKSWCNVSLVDWGLYGWRLFFNGEEVKDLVIPAGVTSIGEGMEHVSPLSNCASLTSVTIPSSVTKMYSPFSGCSNLTSVTTFAEEPVAIYTGFPNAANSMSNSIGNATLYVPKGSKAAYEAADYWKNFKEIREIEDENPGQKDGYIFTALTPEGVEMAFKVISVAELTCQVGSGNFGEPAVDKAYQGPITIPATVNEYNVTSVGDYAFKGTSITSAIISEGVESMGRGIFRGCRYLKKLEIPSTVKSIGENTFVVLNDDAPVDGYVTDVEAVISHIMEPFEISTTVFGIYNPGPPDHNDIIGEECARALTRAVSGYSTNAILYVPSGTIEKYKAIKGWTMFRNIVEMGNETSDLKDGDVFTALTPEGVELTFKVISVSDKTCQLGDGENCSFSSSYNGTITIPAMANGYSVITIAPWACGNSNITAAIISQGIQNIEDRAFGFNSNLESISLPEGLTRIGNSIVWGCSKLRSFHVPSTVQEFETQFGWCDALEQITVAEGNTIYDSRENCNAVIEKATNKLIAGCKATVIPNTVERLSSTSFGFLTSLTKMIIPEGVKALDNQVFAHTSLSTITIPSTVESIGSWSFEDCDHLVEVKVNCMTPFTLRDDVFTDIAYNGTLYVPFGSKSLYDADDVWSNFQNIIEMESEEIISFADSKVKDICVKNWDTNGDGELSKTEAANVTSLGMVFKNNKEIVSFDELQYFTGLTTIPEYAFCECESLKSIRFPKSLTSIGEYAFDDCTSLETVVSFAEIPLELGESVFCGWEESRIKYELRFTLYVPVGTKGLYRESGWGIDESHGDYRTILSGTPENPGSFTVDGIVYDPIDATTVELVDGKKASGNVTIPSTVSNGSVIYQVAEIGASAFKGNTSLTSVEIPNSIKTIRPFAFNGCTGLNTVTSFIETPFSLSLLKGIFLNGENVVYASSLQFTLYVPTGTKSLYEEASWTDASRIVEMGGEESDLKDGDKFTAKTEGGNVLTFEVLSAANKTCEVVRKEYEGNTFVTLASRDVVIPSEVNGFKVVSIGYEALIAELTSLTIPKSLTSIKAGAFENYDRKAKIGEIRITDLTAFCNIKLSDPFPSGFSLHLNGEEVTMLTIPEGISYVGEDTWDYSSPFSGCISLTSAEIPNGVTSIGYGAFRRCTNLTSVSIPKTLTSIGYGAFDGCTNVTSFTSYVEQPSDIQKLLCDFGEFCANATLYVPKGSKAAYEAADGWKDFKEIVEVTFGDANADGEVSQDDVELVKEYILTGKADGLNFNNADTNGNKQLNAADIVKILNIIKNKNSKSGMEELGPADPELPEPYHEDEDGHVD